jgi:hypothetical protein
MKTVRFSQVVAKLGKPEVYLPFSKDDPLLKKAIKTHRMMTSWGAHEEPEEEGDSYAKTLEDSIH